MDEQLNPLNVFLAGIENHMHEYQVSLDVLGTQGDLLGEGEGHTSVYRFTSPVLGIIAVKKITREDSNELAAAINTEVDLIS